VDEASADRRVVIIALSVMVALVIFGVGFGSLFAATNCRQLRPIDLDAAASGVAAPVGGVEAREMLLAAGVDATAITAAEGLLGGLGAVVPVVLDVPLRIGPHRDGVLVTGDGAVLIGSDAAVVSGVTFRRPITVVGDGAAVFALVVGNTITGQVDALRPLIPTVDGFDAGTCVDTSAVGSPLSFLHDARGGNMLGLRTDEDGTDAVLELRDPTRGRVWAPVVELPRAPAGLQGARTSGAIGPDLVVMARRIGVMLDDRTLDDPGHAVEVFGRTDGASRWTRSPADIRAVLPTELADVETLRLEVAHVDTERALVTVAPDVPADALLPFPVHGPLGQLDAPDPRTVTLELALDDGRVLSVRPGAASVGRDGPERTELIARLAGVGLSTADVLPDGDRTWVLVGRLLARFG
jgi:hypothetical protein